MVCNMLCGTVPASPWLCRGHAAYYMGTLLLALDASLGQNTKKRTRDVSSRPDEKSPSVRGLVFIRSSYDEARDRVHDRITRSM